MISFGRIFKKTALAILITGGVFGVTIWAFGNEQKVQTEIHLPPTFPQFEKVVSVKSPATSNLTSDLSRAIAKELVEKNPSGPQLLENTQSILTLDPDKLIGETLAQGMENFDPALLAPPVKESEIIVSQFNTKQTQEQYFKSFAAILITDLPENPFSNTQAPQIEKIKLFITELQAAEKDFLALPVPTSLKDFHLKEIKLVRAYQNLFGIIANYETDPVQALVALQYANDLSTQFSDLLTAMNAFALKNNLALQ